MTVKGGFTTVSYRYVPVSYMKPVTDPRHGDDSGGDNNNEQPLSGFKL